MYCRKCGKAIADDSLFCQYCGTKVEFVNPTNPSTTFTPAKVFDGPSPDFIYSGMLETLSSYFKKVGKGAVITVISDKTPWMQIIYSYDPDNEEDQGIMLYFYPMFDKDVVQRFKNCYYKNDFDMDEENNNFLAFYEKDDYERAAKVTSYILAVVYQIPTNTKFKYDLGTCD